MWAIEKWIGGSSTPRMREELNAQSFALVGDHYTGINVLTHVPWLADLIARRLERHWCVSLEQIAGDDFRMVVRERYGAGLGEFVFRLSGDSMYATRYLLHAVLSIPPDVFGMVAKSFSTLVKQEVTR
jgi:hypothetical protein